MESDSVSWAVDNNENVGVTVRAAVDAAVTKLPLMAI
jgi:hypothetical protein